MRPPRLAGVVLWSSLAVCAACAESADGPDLDAGDGADAATLPDAEGFAVTAHTELGVDGRLTLVTNLPAHPDACAALFGAPCDDVDADGLVDAWEDLALDRLRPIQSFDEGEEMFGDSSAVLALIGRVFPTAGGARILLVLGYSRDYGYCGVTAHNGDSERVAMDLEFSSDDATGVRLIGAYTAAHEGEPIVDRSQVHAGDAVLDLEYAEDQAGALRWRVYPARDKHGTYVSVDVCQEGPAIECVSEKCGPDGVDPGSTDRVGPVWNVGEEAAPRLEALDVVGFPGDHAWLDQPFCGGRERNDCATAIRVKFVDDPFEG